jgi:hypothetical protein
LYFTYALHATIIYYFNEVFNDFGKINMIMIYQLNLPKPSDYLISLVKRAAEARPTNYASKEFHESVQGSDVNCAAGDFFSDQFVSVQAKIEFQRFFPIGLYPLVGIIKNTNSKSAASYGPHTDRVRTVGINYYIEAGGTNVTTVFYDKEDPDDDDVGGNMLPYNQLSKIGEQHFKENAWYMFGTRRFHSVEGIETTRLVLTLSLFQCKPEDLTTVIRNYSTACFD